MEQKTTRIPNKLVMDAYRLVKREDVPPELIREDLINDARELDQRMDADAKGLLARKQMERAIIEDQANLKER